MNLNITNQYQSLVREKEQLKKRVARFDRRFYVFQKYLRHIADIKKSREQIKKNQVISQEELFNKLGI